MSAVSNLGYVETSDAAWEKAANPTDALWKYLGGMISWSTGIVTRIAMDDLNSLMGICTIEGDP